MRTFRLTWVLGVVLASALCGQETVRGRVPNPHGPLKVACENCHTTVAWRPIRTQPEFDHNQTTFPLRARHADLACRTCHVSLVFADAGTQCAACHADIHRRQFGNNCQDCHTVRGWNVAVSAIRQHTNRFPLIGAHAATTCDSCHVGAASGTFTGLSTQCVSCHMRDYQTAAPLNHRAAKLPQSCENCHAMDRWQGARFDHSAFTTFPLTGAHAAQDCASCHINGRFQVGADCFGCHASAFNKTQNPNHVAAAFPHDCALCHSNVNWDGAVFDHTARTGFALTGAHTSQNCAQCHVGGRFAGTPADCAGCHLSNFDKTTNPDHRKLHIPTTCDTCHTTANWDNAKFDHNTLTAFPLAGAHASIACAQCHGSSGFASVATACVGCHLTDFRNAANPNHVSLGFPQDCAVCHTSVQWMGAKFDHNTATKFALTGAHGAVACAQCHVGGQFAGTPMQCGSCHLSDFKNTSKPNHVAAGFPQDCATCHTTTNWDGAKFDHATMTKFALTGAHGAVACAQCHANNVFAGTQAACSGCHLTDYRKTTNPNHVAAAFPQDCATCHTTVNWNGAKFDHTAMTKFALTGAHATVDCAQCHANGRFAGTPAQCIGCHQPDFQKANSPNHVAAGFPQDCAVCHTTAQWLGVRFDHSTYGFQLTGAHAPLQCAQCHVANNFNLSSPACIGCHLTDFNGTANPNHKAANFPQDCQVCHSTVNWAGAVFNHNATKFALTGAHAGAQCAQCHVNSVFAGLSTACSGCHMNDYNTANSPNHKAAGFPQDCAMCHNVAQWAGARFDHSTTGFALTGAHNSAQCAQCHVNNNYSLTGAACINCHLTDFNGATNPNHKAANFSQNCTTCHTTAQWAGATFNHASTGFALTGAHTSVQCALCHVNNNYSLTSAACINCHLADYNGATSPNHKTAGFPQDCTSCHTTAQWAGATFNHASTGFALTGAHTSVQCALCHVNNNYSLTSAACVNCHLTNYNGTTNPNHKTAGFPQDCSICHSTTNWTGATFNHAATGFALTGAHTSVACASCHVNNVFANTSTDCYFCHKSDYTGVTNPNHSAAAFPTTCATCHTTATWSGATFSHTRFPIYTGNHANKWTTCADCHANSANYSVFSCIICHQHSQANVDPKHRGRSGYVYNATSCYSCHPTGRGD